MEPKENKRLRDLVKELVSIINSVFSESKEIKNALRDFEDEGYHADLILASIAKISPKDKIDKEKPLVYEFNNFDEAFLKALKIRLDPGKNKEQE